MRKWFRKHVERYMIRPIIYKASARFAYLLAAVLIWDRFINAGRQPAGLSLAFALVGFGFLLMAWMAYLRTDGFSIPRLKARHKKKKKADVLFGDMIDYVDEPITEYADLDEDEQNIVLMLADAICAVIYLVLSCFV